MAYTAVPGPRIEYDKDGTRVYVMLTNGTYLGQATTAELAELNDDQISTYWSGNAAPYNGAYQSNRTDYDVFMFPVPMTLTHHYTDGAGNLNALEYSSDTTTGLDGTWTAMTWTKDANTVIPPIGQRTKIIAFTGGPITGVKALRMNINWNNGNTVLFAFHLYGYPTSTPEALQIWHPSLNQRIDPNTQFNLGAVVQGGQITSTFRVKNVGSTYTTNNVIVAANTPGGEATLVAAVQFSLDNATWFSTVNVGSLTPGQISALVYMRATTPVAIGPLPHVFRIQAVGTP